MPSEFAPPMPNNIVRLIHVLANKGYQTRIAVQQARSQIDQLRELAESEQLDGAALDVIDRAAKSLEALDIAALQFWVRSGELHSIHPL